jgi:radical SAM protein with 4Fe4S-binding SPASM domain
VIDFEKIEKAYSEDGFYSLQLEVGDICYQGCIYCYMNALPKSVNSLTDETIYRILHDATQLNITAIEWLGGEPLLRESVFQFMTVARDLGLKNNMWTGGLPLQDRSVLEKTSELCRNGLISFHLSTINSHFYKILHPDRPVEDIQTIVSGIRDLLASGYPPNQVINSVTYTGLQPAEDMIETMNYFDSEFGIKTSLNVYHTYLRPGTSKEELKRFIPPVDDVARVYKNYTSFMEVKNLPLNCVNKQYCSATLAVLNDGTVSPCATIREGCTEKVNGSDLYSIVMKNRDYLCFKQLKDPKNLPQDCRQCGLNKSCWGCRSRAYAAGEGLLGKDPRCFRRN